METLPHCTVSPDRRRFELLWIALLTVGVLLVHGYHPWAEDGGLYVAGVEYKLDPALFPHQRAFVTEHLGYSIFAPVLATAVRQSHLSLATVLLIAYLFSTALMLFAALRLAQRCFPSTAAQWTAVALLSAWWTLPIAATSLLLMDPYVTARSFSTPLSLLALAAAMQPWRAAEQPPNRSPNHRKAIHPALACAVLLLLAAAFHPLMAAYALGLVLMLRLMIEPRATWTWATLLAAVLIAASALQAFAPAETPAAVAAAHSRYYWFLSQWHWYEWMGLLGPVLILLTSMRSQRPWTTPLCRHLCRAGIALALLATAVALIFAEERLRAHPVARLQPLRAFLLLYVVMILICGGALATFAERLASRGQARALGLALRALPTLLILCLAAVMFHLQRATFPNSTHLELPHRNNPNPWLQAFVWVRDHTPPDTLFALDAHYINTPGEDAQTFRAIAQRSALPDFAKDGGQAANTPRLAPEWERAVSATEALSNMTDRQRTARLGSLGVQWLILHADAPTLVICPYRNAIVKVCPMPPS